MKYIFVLLVLGVSAGLAGGYSVMVPNVTRIDIEYFHDNGYDIEGVFGTKVRLYVDDEQETILRNMGYRVFAEEVPTPLVAYPTIAEINASMNAVVAAHPDIA
ncbi:MAG: hypothetical protein U9P42_04830, partial [Candidatus Fermentibacteria bacterium]|nr:hypothetical protein [Candidatus Fermentibacteria bacterium]